MLIAFKDLYHQFLPIKTRICIAITRCTYEENSIASKGIENSKKLFAVLFDSSFLFKNAFFDFDRSQKGLDLQLLYS
jgi:hypothetical protein